MEVNNIVLIDLCSRLPYRVKVEHNGEVKSIARYDTRERFELTDGTITSYVNLKPYLRPMSSMTKEEKVYLSQRHFYEGESAYANVYIAAEVVDWMTKHHLDFRGLIPKGLALEAPEGMYKI